MTARRSHGSAVDLAYRAAQWRSSDRCGARRCRPGGLRRSFQQGGALERLDPDRPGGFALLYGVVRIVALRVESSQGRGEEHAPPEGSTPQVAADLTSLAHASTAPGPVP